MTPSANANGNDPNGHHQPRRRKNHRGGANKKKRNRRKSFAVLPEESHDEAPAPTPDREGFYLRSNLSNTSIESEELLDHR